MEKEQPTPKDLGLVEPVINEGEVKEFSREYSGEERRDLASQIQDLRQQYFDRMAELDRSGLESEQRITEKESIASQGMDEVERLQVELDNKESSVISRLLHFRAIPRLRQQLELTDSQLTDVRGDIEELGTILEEISVGKTDFSELDRVRELLESFYRQESVKYQEYLADREAAKVGSVCEKYDCLILHGLMIDRVPGANSLLKDETSWQDKMKIVVALRPGISTSTFQREPQSRQSLWSPIGVVISEGKVDYASPGDSGTIAAGATRKVHGRLSGRISEQIETAVQQRYPGQYNELVVSEPDIAALYCVLDDSPESVYNSDHIYVQTHLAEIMAQSVEMKVPLVVFMTSDGQWHLMSVYNHDTDSMERTDRIIDAAEIRQLPTGLTSESRSALQSEVLSGNIFEPFKVGGQEIVCVHDRLRGYEAGLRLQLQEGKLTVSSRETLQEETYNVGLEPGQEINVIKRLQMFGKEKTYFYLDSNPTILLELSRSPKGYLEVTQIPDGGEYVYTFRGTTKLSRQPENSHDMIELITENISTLNNRVAEIQQNPEYEETLRERFVADIYGMQKTLSFLLYGLAECYREQGNEELATLAIEKAAVVVSQETYQDVLKRRLSLDGELVLIKEDIFVRNN